MDRLILSFQSEPPDRQALTTLTNLTLSDTPTCNYCIEDIQMKAIYIPLTMSVVAGTPVCATTSFAGGAHLRSQIRGSICRFTSMCPVAASKIGTPGALRWTMLSGICQG